MTNRDEVARVVLSEAVPGFGPNCNCPCKVTSSKTRKDASRARTDACPSAKGWPGSGTKAGKNPISESSLELLLLDEPPPLQAAVPKIKTKTSAQPRMTSRLNATALYVRYIRRLCAAAEPLRRQFSTPQACL